MSLHYSQEKSDPNQLTSSTTTHRRQGRGENVGQRKLSRGSSSVERSPPSQYSPGHHHGHHPSPNIRKYLVLLQDSLAIKFVSCSTTTSTVVGHNGRSTTPTSSLFNVCQFRAENCSGRQSSLDEFHHGGTEVGQFAKGLSQEILVGKGKSRKTFSADSSYPGDYASQGLYLYQSFCNVNLKCHWNPLLFEAIGNLTYKGYIVPLILLVTANPGHLTVLRGAWSRQMLRSPPGYRIEFIGEVEEVLGDPIPQSQFAPLSDSLCWAILEVTSSGQEAFVDAILQALNAYFPTMIMPNRELVYQALEKLVRDRKIYQTPTGYFVVHPDGQIEAPRSSHFDLLVKKPSVTQQLSQDSDKVSRHSWDSTASTGNAVGEKVNEVKEDCLRRHNSLKLIRQKDKEEPTTRSLKFLRGRSFSFRMYKSQSTPLRSENSESLSSPNNDTCQRELVSKSGKSDKKSKLGATFFKKLLKRSSKKSVSEIAIGDEPSSASSNAASLTKNLETTSNTAATQTPSLEPAKVDGRQYAEKSNRTFIRHGFETQATPPPILRIECNGSSTENLYPNGWDTPRRALSRLSLNTPIATEDDRNLYAYPRATGIGNSFRRGEFTPSSTISRGSIGYGSQEPTSSLAGAANTESGPGTPSVSPNPYVFGSNRNKLTTLGPPPAYSHLQPKNPGSYKNSYDYYRRRYPAYESYTKRLKFDRENLEKVPQLTRNGTWGPTSASHYYETIDRPKTTMTEERGNLNKSENKHNFPRPTPSTPTQDQVTLKRNDTNPFVTTTTVTQQSTTNMEVKLRLPTMTRTNGPNCVNLNVNGSRSQIEFPKSDKTQSGCDQPRGETEIKTTISHCGNGSLKTHFDFCDNSVKTK